MSIICLKFGGFSNSARQRVQGYTVFSRIIEFPLDQINTLAGNINKRLYWATKNLLLLQNECISLPAAVVRAFVNPDSNEI